MNRPKLKKGFKLATGFCGGYVITFLIPFFLDIALICLIVWLTWKRVANRHLLFIIGLMIGSLLRLLIIAIVLGILWTSPHYLPLMKKNPTRYFFVLGSEGGLYEGMVRHYAHRISVGDPFTGEPLKKKDGYIYSVGPDGKDDYLITIYDPTNGIVSAGDIPIPTR